MVKILTVDDSASMRKMVTYTLTGAGFEVKETCDGAEAYEWVQKNNPPDLVLSDINMPNMDGLTLVKHLREMEKYKYIPILLLTTEFSEEKKMEGKKAGATGWLVKPFNPELLIKTINRVVNK